MVNRVNGQQVNGVTVPTPEQRSNACRDEINAALELYGCTMHVIQTFVDGVAQSPEIKVEAKKE